MSPDSSGFVELAWSECYGCHLHPLLDPFYLAVQIMDRTAGQSSR